MPHHQHPLQNYIDIFDNLKGERAVAFDAQHDLSVKSGYILEAAVLKILKPAWSNDPPSDLLNTNGLFFSVWVDDACLAAGIARYNLHAKKLREIKSESFAAREFARSFRAQSKDALAGWPNWSYPKGPITLFEGHVPLDASTLHAETSKLMDSFAELTPLLDDLLDL